MAIGDVRRKVFHSLGPGVVQRTGKKIFTGGFETPLPTLEAEVDDYHGRSP